MNPQLEARLIRAHIAHTTSQIAPDRRRRHGYGWTVALAILALAFFGMSLR